ncbi:MAG: DUF1566 domain-containing protein [Campylobacterota bacterium]|nr:DUF1566 domain-containing protein [Campylobacterota bacterium]
MRIIWIVTLTFSMMMAEATMVKDPKTNLIWEDNMHVSEVKITQIKARSYCSQLALGSFNDWRLPTLKELQSIVDYKRYKPAIVKEFKHVNRDTLYWSSTPYVKSSDEFWGISFKDGSSSNASEIYDRYVRCVRDIK